MSKPGDDRPCRRVELPGSRTLSIRPVQAHDAPDLMTLYQSLSEDDRYCRFFTAHGPPRRTVEKLTKVEERGGFTLVAALTEADGSSHLVGEAGYAPLPNGNGELGITVAEPARGWLGPYLLDALVEQAAARGVPNIEAQVLVVNRRMFSLLRRRGLVYLEQDEPSIAHVAIGTSGRVPTWPGGHERRRVLVEVPGGRWRSERAARKAGFEVIACPGPLGGWARCPALRGEPCPLVAGADLVVDAVPDEPGRALLEAHQRMYPSVPVCMEVPSGGNDTVPRVGRRDPDGAVVEVLQRISKAIP